MQPIGMIVEVMDRRLQSGAPDIGQVQDSMERINGFSKAAVQSSLDVVGWLAPDDTAPAPRCVACCLRWSCR